MKKDLHLWDMEIDGIPYIDREVVRETEKAYLCKFEYNNRRDGCGTRQRWVAKSICKPMSETKRAMREDALNVLPEDLKWIIPFYVAVPASIGGQGIW